MWSGAARDAIRAKSVHHGKQRVDLRPANRAIAQSMPGGYISLRGHVAEWLRNGLQNRVPRFNSGRGLHLQLSFPLAGTSMSSTERCRTVTDRQAA